jgi:hypothetical protein
MSHLGVHFALSSKDLTRLSKLTDREALLEFITDDLEERYLNDRKWAFETDKAWDAIHRCLTDGRLLYASGPFPLAYAVLGGRRLDVGDDYTACLASAARVRKVSKALIDVDEAWMRKRYRALSKTDYGECSAEDFDYTWTSFQGLPTFFAKAAKAGRAVLFTTDC